MDSCVAVILVLCALTVPGKGDDGTSSKPRSCSDIRKFYSGKGFSLDNVPSAEISGEHLRVCPQGYTCCTTDMEDKLTMLSIREMETSIETSTHSQQTYLNSQSKALEGLVMEALNRSEGSLQESFSPGFGSLYAENTRVFSDLYRELRRYIRSPSSINLEEALNEFWSRLFERLYKAINSQYIIVEDTLECLSKKMDRLRPFGTHRHQMETAVMSTFISTRSFSQALILSGEVMRRVSQVRMTPECRRSVMKMTYCPHCRGMASAKPCPNYCLNVMKGCLANNADMDAEWNNMFNALEQVLGRLESQANVETVILSLPSRIAEAITTLVENMDTLNPKVSRACGGLKEAGTSGAGQDESKTTGKVTVAPLGNGATLGKLTADLRTWMSTAKSYWITQPAQLCGGLESFSGAVDDDKCWNGMTRGRYLPEVMGDGLYNQLNNPEVEIDITKPSIAVRRQIMYMRVMTNRITNALNGNDVEFQDTSDDVSGSGSGSCGDENCHRGPRLLAPNTEPPRVYGLPPENKKVKSTASQHLPCTALSLLSLAALLLRR